MRILQSLENIGFRDEILTAIGKAGNEFLHVIGFSLINWEIQLSAITLFLHYPEIGINKGLQQVAEALC